MSNIVEVYCPVSHSFPFILVRLGEGKWLGSYNRIFDAVKFFRNVRGHGVVFQRAVHIFFLLGDIECEVLERHS
jgi:hypothetical protein